MPKYKVLMHGRDVRLQDEEKGAPDRAGFYVNCCVEAADAESAGNLALDELGRHPKYLLLEAWPRTGTDGRPAIRVDSVDRVPFGRRNLALGITTGYAFHVDPDEQAPGTAEQPGPATGAPRRLVRAPAAASI